MTAKAKSVLSVAGEALETAAGYALIAVALYAVLFVDITGGGSLWKTMGYLHEGAQEGIESPNATRVVKVATQVNEQKAHEDRILAVFDQGPKDHIAAAVYQAPDATNQRPSAALTDTPADPQAGKSWKRGLKGELRTFTVYGNGQETTSASLSGASSRPQAQGSSAGAPAARAAAPQPAETVAARPGLGSRLSGGALAASDATRNIR
jgi:hypothetical protein